MSSLLHERLQRERRVASIDVNVPSDAQQPGFSGGSDPTRRKGWGIKEMEHTLSTLHKQNFDLKLELFHRREKQTAMEERLAVLEERLEILESEKVESIEMNDLLVRELEKRDKAVEEAVTMIVALESRVEQLLREREMARSIDLNSSSPTRIGSPAQTPNAHASIHKNANARSEPSKVDEPKTLSRMPSFVSEPTENTHNLRNVYLGAREPSVLSLPRTEDTPNTTRNHGRLASPVPSILSESSFVSIYGRNRTIGEPVADDSPPPAEQLPNSHRTKLMLEDTPTKAPRPAASHLPRNGATQFRNISDVLDVPPSPPSRLDRLRIARAATQVAPRDPASPPTSSNGKDKSPFASPAKTKKEKREALQKVLTQGSFNNAQQSKGLPPTPDTLSTTTLHRQPTAAEELAAGRHSRASSVDTWLRESLRPGSVDPLDPMSSVSQADPSVRSGRISPDLFSFPSSTAGWAADAMFGSLNGAGIKGAGGKASPATPMADMLDAIGRSTASGQSSSDPLAATLTTAAPPPPNRCSSLLACTGPRNPDTTRATDSTPQSTSLTISPSKNTTRANRARSNSNADIRPPTRHLADMGLKQDRAMTVPPKQVHVAPPPQENMQSQPLPKQRHYPPTASQASRPRSRGLNNFFRRSIGSSSDCAQLVAPSSAPATETTFRTSSTPLVGIPSWVRRSSLVSDEDRSSATPPPILRKKPVTPAQTTPNRPEHDDDGGVALSDPAEGGAPLGNGGTPLGNGGAPLGNGGTPVGNGGAPLGNGAKRKWLGLGSLRNRGA